ncbi:hypothetical protein HOF78_00930 [Candidatus Woesearchaeota archaeon]|jgi:hypothetical protein|nr:hypothetical protein [Candidatus Woesearchaeota archaeon]MBT6045050.1 hypothetical protein [Candidatus Woesearchaeota archaeon]
MKEDDTDEGLLKLLKESMKNEEVIEEVFDTDKAEGDEAFDEAFQMLLEYYEGYKVDDTLSPFFHED